ncbi:MAG: cytochrome c family protein [Phycisphaerales bacterium]|nr:cytochrome c family protein [Phycisphaerales bacterium]
MNQVLRRRVRQGVVFGAVTAVLAGLVGLVSATPLLNTQLEDFYMHGSQPYPNVPANPNFDPLLSPQNCASCHADESGIQPGSYSVPYNRWAYSMMAQSFRDPIFQAQFDITEKDAPFSGDGCMKCHAPAGWLQGRANIPGATTPADGQNFAEPDRSGVSCSICHRMVDPVADPANPPVDAAVFAQLAGNTPPNFPAVGLQPGGPLNAVNSFIIDNRNNRRGPFDPENCFHLAYESPFHKEAGLCAGCHDVSNPVYLKQGDGSYAPTPMGQAHPTGNKYDMYPMDRTYSEWLMSDFATPTGVQLTVPNPNVGDTPEIVGRYSYDGVTRTIPEVPTDPSKLVIFNANLSYTTCQSCHMPPTTGFGADPNLGSPLRTNAPVHNFTGTNTWVLHAVQDVWGASETLMLDDVLVQESVDRNKFRMTQSSDMELTFEDSQLKVRIYNNAGHKLPGGFAEGRRMWINVKFFDGADTLVGERGAYDSATAVITEADTKVYELIHGVDATVSFLTGLPIGKSFHLDINNTVVKDNRIPPRGFTNARFAAIQSAPVGTTYADGQHWDDTFFALPPGAARAEVQVLHQTTGKDYIEFLRDNATTIQPLGSPNSMPQQGTWIAPPGTPMGNLTTGQIAYAQWVKWGKSAPVVKDSGSIVFAAPRCSPADIAYDDGAALPPLGVPGGTNNGVTEGDYNLFFSVFFDAGAVCDIANDDGSPLPPFGLLATNNGTTEADYNLFFSVYFDGCP